MTETGKDKTGKNEEAKKTDEPENMNALLLKDVKKTYEIKGGKSNVAALRGVNMEIKRGAMIAIKGPSGSGKTTLLQMIGALDVPTSGEVWVNGKNISKMKEKDLTEYRGKTIGFVFQSFNLIPNLTALENVELPMEARNIPKKKRRERASELLETVGMDERTNYKPLKLSGGEAQRVAIARALANEPSIILADEPTGNLDSKTGTTIISLLDKLRTEKGTTVMIVTHSDSVARMCDRTFTIKDGKITSEEDTKKLAETDDVKKVLRIALSASDKIVEKLVNAGYADLDALSRASIEDLVKVLGDRSKAEKIVRKVKLLKDNEEWIS
jgi:putative ABC transport system ATP-binding protein